MPRKSTVRPGWQLLSVAFALMLFPVAYIIAWGLADGFFSSWMVTSDARMARLVLALVALPIWVVLCRILSAVFKLSKK
jgi:hypothetical protein